MMKQTKWSISLLFCLILIAIGTAWARSSHVASRNVLGGSVRNSLIPAPIPLPSMNTEIGSENDSVMYASTLNKFFESLDSLQEGKDTVISIVHLGDSHLQNGSYSGRIMQLMQAQFGNAGRGWIAPFRLSHSNAPEDFFITSDARSWIGGRCIQANPKCPIGLGGIGIQTNDRSFNMNVGLRESCKTDYAFNKVVFYRNNKSMAMLPDTSGVSIKVTSGVTSLGITTDTFYISNESEALRLHTVKRCLPDENIQPPSSFRNIYYGFNLTNGKPGILLHSIGVNGAHYCNYTDENYVRQLALLKPALLIISLGTNETFGKRFDCDQFAEQIHTFLSLIKEQMPSAAIILTTPPECFKRTRVRVVVRSKKKKKKRTRYSVAFVRNTNTELAAKTIITTARKEGVACWDLFSATGGKGSSNRWYQLKLMTRDRVHFTNDGYQEQGTLLFRALMQSYNKSIAKGI